MLFIHVPRTGGRSICQCLGLPPSEHHTTLHLINTLGEQKVNNEVKFSVVRNPWARAYSWWKFFVNTNKYHGTPEQQESFEKWILAGAPTNPPITLNEGLSHPLNHMDYYKDANGQIRVEHLLHYENLEGEFALMKIGKLPHVGNGETDSIDYRTYYTKQAMIDFVADLNKELLSRFGYMF